MSQAQTAHYLALDGQDDQLFVSSVQGLDGLSTFTLEGWVRSTGGNWADKILEIGTDPNYRLTLQASCGAPDNLEFNEEKPGIGSNVTSPLTNLCDGQWHHIVATDNGSLLRLYLDGSEIGTSPAIGATWDMNGRVLRLGARILGSTDFWKGDLDEFRVWRRPLTAAEVANSATWQVPADSTDLVSWWDFENGGTDVMGTNSGVLLGDATVVTTPGYPDCNSNGVVDSLDISSGTSQDCNSNGVPDECDIASGFSFDIDGDGQLDDCVAPPLMADTYELSVAAGGTQAFSLTAPVSFGLYLLLGTTSGTSPGTPSGGFVIPLNVDSYLIHTALSTNVAPLAASFGALTPSGASGTATASFALPADFSPSLVGLTLHHAYVTIDLFSGNLNFVSNAVPVALVP